VAPRIRWFAQECSESLPQFRPISSDPEHPEDNLQNINKAVDKEFEKKSLKEIAAAPVSALQGLAAWYTLPTISRDFTASVSTAKIGAV
jgi:hypothetical protein